MLSRKLYGSTSGILGVGIVTKGFFKENLGFFESTVRFRCCAAAVNNAGVRGFGRCVDRYLSVTQGRILGVSWDVIGLTIRASDATIR